MATRWLNRGALKRRFQLLATKAQANVRQAVLDGANEIVAMQKRLAPQNDGDLRDSITAKPVKSRTGVFAVEIEAGDMGPDKPNYARYVEFGTAPHKAGGRFAGAQHPGTQPNPFFFPAYRALRKRVKARIRRALKKAVVDSKTR